MGSAKVVVSRRLYVAWIVIIYMACGIAWILFSDYSLELLNVKNLQQKQTLKGIFYVLITGILLFYILSRFVKRVLSAQHVAIMNEQKFRDIFQHANDGIALFNMGSAQSVYFVASNDLFQQLTGYTDEELRELPTSTYMNTTLNQDKISSLMKYGHLIHLIDIKNKDGEVIAVEVNSKLFPKGDHNEIVSIFRDIRDRNRAQETIHYLANHDYLTTLPNPRVFHQTMNQYIAIQEGFLLFIIRLDRYRWSRHTLGRKYSNEIIRMIAERLVRIMDNTALITRISDESFKVIIPGRTYSDFQAIYGMIKENFLQPFKTTEDEVVVEVDIGVACYPNDGLDAESIIRNSYHTLSIELDGLSELAIDETQRRLYRRKLKIEEEIPFALDRGQLFLLYQPKVDSVTGTTVGVEALLRWTHPELGIVAPEEFIPIAEEIGTIISIGLWVLREACKQWVYIHETSGKEISMAVNISTRQFMQQNFVELVKQAIVDTQIRPEFLILEITESIAINVEASLPVLQQLKALGVKISMDDFGTGYCSLSYLKYMPMDELKIDSFFIRNLTSEGIDGKLVEIIINLAHSMKLQVVAEGVEDEDQLNRLKELNCELIQGYYFSRPLHIDALISYMQ